MEGRLNVFIISNIGCILDFNCLVIKEREREREKKKVIKHFETRLNEIRNELETKLS